MWEILFSDASGKLYDAPGLGLIGRTGNSFVEPLVQEMIPLPPGATLSMIPQRHPVAIDLETDEFISVTTNPYEEKGGEIFAVGALLPQGYTRTLLPAFTGGQDKGDLPLLGYTLCGIKDGQIYVAATPTDQDHQWSPRHFNTPDLGPRVEELKATYPQNRIIQQLGTCALKYGCFTAQNIFYQRWEGGIPVSPACNARCVGCISKQPAECCPSPQQRLDFVPEVQEVVELAVGHLSLDPQAIVSFGQGCEGEPALQAPVISQAIREIRQQLQQGTINMNTNAGYTQGIIQICDAGIDSLRVSLNSARQDCYQPYYQPLDYSFSDVVNSLKAARERGVFVALNLLFFPGVNDREEELEALLQLVEDTGVGMIQLRNLNIDPKRYMELVPPALGQALGVMEFIDILKKELPHVAIGSYSKPQSKSPKME